MKKMNKFLT